MMDDERTYVTEITTEAPETKRKKYPGTAKFLRVTHWSMWLSLCAVLCMGWLSFIAILFIFLGALDRTGSNAGQEGLDSVTLAFWMIVVFVAVLAALIIYRMIMAVKEFGFYIFPVIAFVAALAAYFAAGREMNVFVIALIYIGYMIMSIGTLYACRKVFPEKPLLKSGIVALALLHVCGLLYLIPPLRQRLDDRWSEAILLGAVLVFQAFFYMNAASLFSEFLPKRRSGMRRRAQAAETLVQEVPSAEETKVPEQEAPSEISE